MNGEQPVEDQVPKKEMSPGDRKVRVAVSAWIGLGWVTVLGSTMLLFVNPAIARVFFFTGWVTGVVSWFALFAFMVFNSRAAQKNKQNKTREPAAAEKAPAPQDFIPNQDPVTPQDDLSGRD